MMATKKTSSLFEQPANHLVTIKLPYPPSLNKYYRVWQGKMTIGTEGRQYRETVKEILGPAFQDIPAYTANLRVWIEVMFPDRRKRDLDNLNKALLDSITKSQVWQDDSLLKDLRLISIGVEKPGYVRLHISELTT